MYIPLISLSHLHAGGSNVTIHRGSFASLFALVGCGHRPSGWPLLRHDEGAPLNGGIQCVNEGQGNQLPLGLIPRFCPDSHWPSSSVDCS